MGLPKVQFNKGQGGLGRPLPGEDHISGFIMPFTNAALPSGFTTSDRIKRVLSLEQAEALGIIEGGAGDIDILWYHVREYFRIQPQGDLYIFLIDDTGIAYDEMQELQDFAGGKIRQTGYYDGGTTFAAANTTTLQTTLMALEGQKQPMQVLYAADISGVGDLTTLADLRALSNKNVSVVIGEDGNAKGAALAASATQSITTLGATLGAVSLAQVHENIGWHQEFPLSEGADLELDVANFANGQEFVKDVSLLVADGLHDKGYIFIIKEIGDTQTYHNGAHVAIALTNDFFSIERNRTIDKAVRGINIALLPQLNSPLFFNPDGTLTEDTIARFKNEADRSLDAMERDSELSSREILIDPTQNSQTTGEIEITVKLQPVGVAEKITVNIGFALTTA